MNCILRKAVATSVSVAMLASSFAFLPELGKNEINAVAASSKSVPAGFVYADGTEFKCDGSPYYFAGTNCYYVIYKSQEAVDNVFDDMNKMGLNVLRTWGHIDVGSKTDNFDEKNPTFQNNGDGTGEKDGVYFQYFDKNLNKPVVNEGANGLGRLDYVISQAEKHNVKLIITFTNYWEAFGGMDQYCNWMKEAGKGTHLRNEFYTNETMKQWYKDYINTLLNHTNMYTGEKLKDSKAIFSWELCNEPRVDPSKGQESIENTVDMGCKKHVLYNWAKEMSEYTKSIDPNHMVCVGDEGFFNFEKDSLTEHGVDSYFAFTGDSGVDYNELMTIDTIDFGTPHMYVDQWTMVWRDDISSANGTDNGKDDDVDWIKLHAQAAKAANKPVILEEFGIDSTRWSKITSSDKSARDPYYKKWLDLMDGTSDDGEYSFAGYTYWMIASRGPVSDGFNNGYYPDYDHYTIYGDAEVDAIENPKSNVRDLIIKSAAKMNAKNETNFFKASSYSYDIAKGGDLTTELSVLNGSSVSSISLGGNVLSSSDYTLTKTGSNSKNVTYDLKIKASALKNLTLKVQPLEVKLTEGANAKTGIDVSNSNVKNASVSSVSATKVDKNAKKTTKLSVTFDLNGNTLKAVNSNGKTLTQGTDYNVSGSTVTFTPSFVRSLPDKKASVEFEFTPGKAYTLDLEVVDTTGLDEFDEFETYNSSDDLWAAYKRNTNGNELSLDVVNKNGSKALAYTYNIGGPDYCGVTKSVSGKQYGDYNGVRLWIQGDGSSNELTLQLQDTNGNYREAYISLSSTTGKYVYIPFSDFKAPSWQGSDTGIDASKITEFSLYVGGDGVKTGTFYVDSIVAANSAEPDIQDDPVKTNISNCTISVPDVTFNGAEQKPTVTVKNGTKTLVNGTDYTVAYSNNTKAGTATVTVTGKGDYEGTASKNFTIIQKSLKYCSVSLAYSEVAFNGSAKKPTVKVKIGNNVMYSGNYTVKYTNNIKAGTATVTITGKGNLQGTVTKTFKIVPKSMKYCTVTLSGDSFNYTGKEIKPTVTVKITEGAIYNSNYTVTYKNNTNKGTATVVITGKNNLTGSVTKTFTIK